MKVLTLSSNALKTHAIDLLSLINKDSDMPNILIGIATGGAYVSRPIKDVLTTQKWQGKYYEIKLSRTSTKTKKNLNIHKVLIKLPYVILNQLRKFEVFLFENFKDTTYHTQKENNVHIPVSLHHEIKTSHSILLIDDAIDTGATMLAIINVIKKINPNITIKTAVLTVTHKKPYIQPDYTLYTRILLRCPWAMDYKGDDKIE